MTPTKAQLADEARRAWKVRQFVDITTSFIMQSNMARPDAEKLVQGIRMRILALFPDGEQAYEVIYAPRFRRLIDEFARVSDDRHTGVVIPFSAANR